MIASLFMQIMCQLHGGDMGATRGGAQRLDAYLLVYTVVGSSAQHAAANSLYQSTLRCFPPQAGEADGGMRILRVMGRTSLI